MARKGLSLFWKKVEKKACPQSDKEEFMEWTNEQKQAIYEKGSNILVAAAARKW